MISATPHPDPETLLRFVDEDLPAEESAILDRHLAGCGECQERSQVLRETLGDYLQFHATVLKPSLPPAPRAWDRIELLMVDPVPRRVRVLQPRVWLAAAAAVLLMLALVRRFQEAPPVDAAVLLTRAAVAENQVPRRGRRIRIRTLHGKWDRPAILSTAPVGDAAEIRSLLLSAGYPTDDPLSAAAFLRWREHLPQKQDHVSILPASGPVESYVVETTSSAGEVSDASLTLRAQDLRATVCTLHLRSEETVEMTELADETIPQSPQPLAAQPAADSRPETVIPQPVGPSEELRVVAALHGIGADLGEPIEIRRDRDAVRVSVSGVDAHRQEQVRAALAGIPDVEIQTGPAASHDPRASLTPRRNVAQPDAPSPLIADLQAALGSDTPPTELANQLIDATDSSMERAYALRALAKRFPVEVTAQLSPASRATLSRILRDHIDSLAESIHGMRRLLAPVLPVTGGPGPDAGAAPPAWQELAAALPASVQPVDRELNAGANVDSDIATRKARLSAALESLGKQVAALRRLVQP